MASVVQKLSSRGLINPPNFVKSNTHYEVIMGSFAYGVSSDSSDMDIYGFCIPSKEIVFPHLGGEILGFGEQKKRFEQYQQHGIQKEDDLAGKGRVYDLTIYNIVKYFHLTASGNPNMIDSLFVPQHCILSCTPIGVMVRERRRLFLSKKVWHSFKGYAYSQLHKAKGKNPIGKRVELREKYGWDVKFGYHVLRLIDEVEQILEHGDLDLTRAREQMKAIRRGEVSLEDVEKLFHEKEKSLESLYHSSSLRHKPAWNELRILLLECLEHHYGSLEKAIVTPDKYRNALTEIEKIIERTL